MTKRRMRNRAAETPADSSRNVNHPVAPSPNVDSLDRYGFTQLTLAAISGNLQKLTDHIALGADPNLRGRDYKNAMCYSIEKGHLPCVEALIAAGANVNGMTGFGGETALALALKLRNVEILKVLIAAGADVNAKAGYGPQTLLELALENRDVQCAEALIAAGADVNARAAYRGKSMLFLALENRLVQCVRALIAAGAGMDERDHRSQTALMNSAEAGHADCVKALIEGGADLDAQRSEYLRLSALMMASAEGHVDCVKALVTAGADLNLEDQYGNTALLSAVKKRHWHCAIALIVAGARDDKDSQAFMEAARYPNRDCVGAFIAAGADVNATDAKGNSVLMNADPSVRRLLRDAGGKITFRHFLRGASKAGIVAGVALAWALVAFGIGALVHWLSPVLPIWGAGILGLLSTPSIVFFAAVSAGQTDYSAYRRIMLMGWASLSIITAALLHWLSPWFSTWAAASVFGLLAAPIACPLALLLPEPSPPSPREHAATADITGKLPAKGSAEVWKRQHARDLAWKWKSCIEVVAIVSLISGSTLGISWVFPNSEVGRSATYALRQMHITTHTLGTILAGLLGLVFGSLLNHCVSRWFWRESIFGPRRYCRSCRHALAWWENIPLLSWNLLQPRCRYCNLWIGRRNPMVELALALLWAVTAWGYLGRVLDPSGSTVGVHLAVWAMAGKMAFYWLALALLVLDAEHFFTPDWLIWPAIFIGAAFSTLPYYIVERMPLLGIRQNSVTGLVLQFVAGMVAAAVLTLATSRLHKVILHAIGGPSDAKLMVLLVAWLGLPAALLAFAIEIVLGTLATVYYRVDPSAREDQEMWALATLNSGTFLCFSGIVSSVWGQPILAAFYRLCGF